MQSLYIRKFGPIDECSIEIRGYCLFIGQQASGKSTVLKLIYYFLNLRDEIFTFLIGNLEKNNKKFPVKELRRMMTRLFLEFWGPSYNDKDVLLKYDYSSEKSISIKLDQAKHRYITPEISPSLLDGLISIYERFQSSYSTALSTSSNLSSVESIIYLKERSQILTNLHEELKELFAFKKDLFFIPAGRSLLSTISDQLQFIHPHQLDYPLRQFIDKINAIKNQFSKSLEDLLKEKQVLSSKPIDFPTIRKSITSIEKILKGSYRHDTDGGKLYIDEKVYTKINFASSGQQEVLWILLYLYLIVLENKKTAIFIEEPEAHLFPDSQKEVMEFFTLIYNRIGCNFYITTHSPYILSTLNNFIFANQLLRNGNKLAGAIVPEDLHLRFENISAFLVKNGSSNSLVDEELKILKTELIDSASESINETWDQLFQIDQ